MTNKSIDNHFAPWLMDDSQWKEMYGACQREAIKCRKNKQNVMRPNERETHFNSTN